jgi:predicted MPP superfamily phosphohydrolase
MESIRILHLSDIHYEKGVKNRFKDTIVDPLIKELEKINSDKKINLILITGDLINKGNAGYDSTETAFDNFNNDFIEPIIKKIGIDKKCIFFVPGNHDVNISLDNKYIDTGLEKALINEREVDSFLETCLSGKIDGIDRILPFHNFEKHFYLNSIHENKTSLFCSTYELYINSIRIGISCVNSVWRYYGKDENLIIGKNQLKDSLSKIINCDLKIFLSHYYKDALCDFEKHLIDDFVTENYDMALLGHDHRLESFIRSYSNTSLFITSGKGNWMQNVETHDIEYINGFSIIDYNTSLGNISFSPKIYSLKRNEYVSDTIIAGNSGTIIYDVTKNCSDTKRLHKIVTHIRETFMEDVNQDLITYGTDTTAPCTLNQIFVDPNLIYRKGDTVEDEEIVTIKEICNKKKNYAIIGVKEVGKTILLDKLVSYYIENINELRTIPVCIKYEDYTHSRFETAISRFTGIQIREIDDLLINEKIVLLIDNLKFTKNDKYKINALIDLCTKYENISIVITINTNINENIPLDFVNSSLYDLCKILYLKYFKTKQISALTEKWFISNLEPDKKEKQNKIINLLTALKLPRTPLAISMFLWILEKQEEYQPTNQSTMLENFIEKLFKKYSKTEALFKEFDYKNKESLLTVIAKKMLESKRENYSLSKAEILTICSDHLNKRRFSYDPEEIISQFVDVGLLVKFVDESVPYMRFRFNCFFQYFLMKNMDDKDFLEHILKEENYLSFYDEIILFTGIKRNRTDILTLLAERMNMLYKNIYDSIAKMPNKFDSFFEVELTYTEQLDRGFIDHISDTKEETKRSIDILTDQMLETVKPNENVQRKEFNLTNYQRIELCWQLVANVLRNTEETEIDGLKYNTYKDILTSSFCFLCLYKFLFVEFLRKKDGKLNKEERTDAELTLQFLPLLHELLIGEVLSSAKLTLVYKEHIDNIINDKSKTQLEKFTAIFLYSDIHGSRYKDYIKDFISQIKGSQIKGKYIYDMTLFKLLTYYYLRSDSHNLDREYENIIADLIVSVKKYPKNVKSEIISSYKKKKRKFISENQGLLSF